MPNDKKKILLLEDDNNLGFILKEHLEMKGYEVKLCRDGIEGSDEYNRDKYSLCLVDIMMPKKNGFTFVREVRLKDNMIPVIFLTAKSLKEDRIEGFKAGCDDYVTKPFSIEELLLRINAVLRRSESAENDSIQTQFQIGKYFFDSKKQLLQLNRKKTELTTRETELLQILCINKNKVLDRETALKKIWGGDSYFNARSMDVFISRLRKYLNDDKNVSIINVHGRGYKLIVN
jgi:DNA-binding response OmpR family regulator